MSKSSKKIVIVEDHPMMRKGLASTLESEPGYHVVGQLGEAEEVLEHLDNAVPDMMIVDVSLPGMNGIELVKNVVSRIPEIKILMVSRHDESLYAERALRAGAKGYIMKFEPMDKLLMAVRRILDGGIYLSNEMNEKLLMGVMQGRRNSNASPMELLSDRELEVFELIGQGKSSREIAAQLHLASKTVETYRSRIKEKLALKNASEMMFHAIKWVEQERTEQRD